VMTGSEEEVGIIINQIRRGKHHIPREIKKRRIAHEEITLEEKSDEEVVAVYTRRFIINCGLRRMLPWWWSRRRRPSWALTLHIGNFKVIRCRVSGKTEH